MTICYFGDYDPNYSRQRVLIKGLRLNGVEVLMCNSRKKGRDKYSELRSIYRSLPKHDLVLVGYSTDRWMVPFARLLSRKPIVWDAFFSIYDNYVFDRKLVQPGSSKAKYYWFLDWLSCKLADFIYLDTQANADYFIKTFHIDAKKFGQVLIGADDRIMYPRERTNHGKFVVEFHGNYIPVQGVEHIVKAAKLLENDKDIQFVLIGDGQEFENISSLANKLAVTNIKFLAAIPFEQLPEHIAEADVCLGLLGDLDRGARAIPNKVYEASAMQRASLNMEGSAIHELYTNREDILLCQGGNARDIADKIMELKNNPELKNKIADNARQLYFNKATPQVLGADLKQLLTQFVK